MQKDNETHISHELKSQGYIISSILTHASQKTRGLWSNVQQHMPKNISNFTIKYPNNTLATRRNLEKWAISQSSVCSFCLQAETFQHVVSSCTVYLEEGRYIWRHNSVILCLAKTLSSLFNCSIYADLHSFLSPSFITGDSLRPYLALVTDNSSLYIIELTVGFESNIQMNSDRKKTKYSSLISDLTPAYSEVTLVNLSMSVLVTMGKSSESLITMLDDLKLDKTASNIIVKKLRNIAIHCTYYVFCCRNKSWKNPDLLDF